MLDELILVGLAADQVYVGASASKDAATEAGYGLSCTAADDHGNHCNVGSLCLDSGSEEKLGLFSTPKGHGS
jgi:hypothetical protein